MLACQLAHQLHSTRATGRLRTVQKVRYLGGDEIIMIIIRYFRNRSCTGDWFAGTAIPIGHIDWALSCDLGSVPVPAFGPGPYSSVVPQCPGTCPRLPLSRDPAPKVPHRPGADAAHTVPTYIVLRLRSQLESPEAPPVSRGSQSRAGDPTLQSSQNLRTTRGSTRSLGQAKCRLGGSAVLTCASYPLCWTSRLRGFHAPCTLLRARTNR